MADLITISTAHCSATFDDPNVAVGFAKMVAGIMPSADWLAILSAVSHADPAVMDLAHRIIASCLGTPV